MLLVKHATELEIIYAVCFTIPTYSAYKIPYVYQQILTGKRAKISEGRFYSRDYDILNHVQKFDGYIHVLLVNVAFLVGPCQKIVMVIG